MRVAERGSCGFVHWYTMDEKGGWMNAEELRFRMSHPTLPEAMGDENPLFRSRPAQCDMAILRQPSNANYYPGSVLCFLSFKSTWWNPRGYHAGPAFLTYRRNKLPIDAEGHLRALNKQEWTCSCPRSP